MPFKWSNDLSIQLIESYKSFECLWNPTHIQYKCINAKHDAWAKLCETTGADEAEIKRKMKNIVAQFQRERKKYRLHKKSGAGAYFLSKWFAYNYMLFLADKNKPRQCTEKGLNETEEFSNTSEEDSEGEGAVSPHSILGDNTDETNSLQADDSQYIEATQTQDNEAQPRPATNESLPEPSVNESNKELKSPKIKKVSKRKHNEVSENDRRQEEAYTVLKELQNKKPRNRFQVFGEHVDLKIERLRTEHAQNTVEHLISNILWEASMGKYDDPANLNCLQYSAPAPTQFQTVQFPMLSPQNSYKEPPSHTPLPTPVFSPVSSCMVYSSESSSYISDTLPEDGGNRSELAETESSIIAQAIRDACI